MAASATQPRRRRPQARRRQDRAGREGRTLGRFESTAYGPPWDSMNGTGVTAGGTDLRPARKAYIVAVDPEVIPLGTRLRIWPNPFGHRGTFLADDTGGAIKGRRIDFYDWRGRRSQLAWGRRTVEVGSGGGAGTLAALVPGAGGGIRPGDALDSAGEAAGDVLGAAGDVVNAIPDAIGRVAEVIEGIARFFIGLGELLLTPEGWLRVGKLLFGAVALWLGAVRLADAVSGGAISRALGQIAGGVAITGRRVAGGIARIPRGANG